MTVSTSHKLAWASLTCMIDLLCFLLFQLWLLLFLLWKTVFKTTTAVNKVYYKKVMKSTSRISSFWFYDVRLNSLSFLIILIPTSLEIKKSKGSSAFIFKQVKLLPLILQVLNRGVSSKGPNVFLRGTIMW